MCKKVTKSVFWIIGMLYSLQETHALSELFPPRMKCVCWNSL